MVRVKVYVEGGGDTRALQANCRRGFREFFDKSGFAGIMPSVSACGGRKTAYEDFCTALSCAQSDEVPVLLVDSEGPVPPRTNPWNYLRTRRGDEWPRPDGATDEQAHLMVQCMETWFMADKEALISHYNQHFRESALPARNDIEEIPKPDILDGLKNATRQTQKREYSKGGHSFDILAKIDPQKVTERSFHARKLIDALHSILDR